ncbi:MAG: hypothetical protein AAFZ58_06295 [Pseudomonadota bacterium]
MRPVDCHKACIALLAALAVGGCSLPTSWGAGRNIATTETQIVEETEVSNYLQTMYALATADAEGQRRTFADLERKSARSPTTTNRLALALARITPGHPATDVSTGRAELERLLADPALLVESERQLVVVMLAELDQQQRIAGASVERLNDALVQANADRDRLARELEASRSRAAELQRELREAEEKLDAITRIERSIRERTDDEPPR